MISSGNVGCGEPPPGQRQPRHGAYGSDELPRSRRMVAVLLTSEHAAVGPRVPYPRRNRGAVQPEGATP